MIANSAIRKLIREQRVFELPRNMEFSTEEEGMHTLDQALAYLVRSGIVSQEQAMMKSSNPAKLNQLLQFPDEARMSPALDAVTASPNPT